MNLRGKQKRFLRAQANHLQPLFAVGKNGLTQAWLAQLDGALDKRELIKISMQMKRLAMSKSSSNKIVISKSSKRSAGCWFCLRYQAIPSCGNSHSVLNASRNEV